jgi:hypothetical protein
MAYQLFRLPRQTPISSNLSLLIGAKAYFYVTQTTTPQDVYSDSALTTPRTNPVIADAAGVFPEIYLDPTKVYRYTLKTAAGAELYTADPVNDSILSTAVIESYLTQTIVAGKLWPTTAHETAAGVTPTSFLYPPYESRRYGTLANGSANDSTALQRLINAAQQGMGTYSCRRAELVSDDEAFKCTAGLTMDPQKLLLEGNGCALDFSTMTSAFTGLKLSASTENLNVLGLLHGARGVRNLLIVMPGYTDNADGVGLELVDTTDDGAGNFRGPRHRLDSISILGGQYALKFGAGSFGECITGLTIGHDTDHELHTGIYGVPSWTDGGEAPCLLGTFIYNGVRAIHLAGAGGIKLVGGNIDGCKTIAKHDGFGMISLVGMYFEFTDGDDTQYKVELDDANSKAELVDCEITCRADVGIRDTTAFAYVDGTLILRNVKFASTNVQWYTANSGFLVEGPGTTVASGVKYFGFPWAPLVSKSLQWLAYPDFSDANALDAFTLSNVGAGDNPVIATISDGTTTKDALHFSVNNTGVLNDESAALFVHDVVPGRTVSTVGQIYAPGMTGSNVRFEIILSFKDSGGNVIDGPFTEVIASATVANWTTFGFSSGVPNGAETVELNFRSRATGAVGADKEVYLSPLGIGFAEGE